MTDPKLFEWHTFHGPTSDKYQLYLLLGLRFGVLLCDIILATTLPNYISAYAQDGVLLYAGLFLSTKSAIQFFCSPTFGYLSDKAGRRPLIIAGAAASVIGNLLMAVIPSKNTLLFVPVILSISSMALQMSYAIISDLSDPKDLTQNYSFAGFSFGAAFIMGPALGGYLGQNLSPRFPFFLTASVSLCVLSGAAFFFRETRRITRDSVSSVRFSFREANPIALISILLTDPVLRMVTAVLFLNVASAGAYQLWPTYAAKRLGWGPAETGVYLTTLGAVAFTSQALCVRWVLPRLGDRLTLAAALVVESLRFVALGTASSTAVAYLSLPLVALSFSIVPILNSFASSSVLPAQQGRLCGALAAVSTLSELVGPMVALHSFAHVSAAPHLCPHPSTCSHMLGLPYYLSAAASLAALSLLPSLFATLPDPKFH